MAVREINLVPFEMLARRRWRRHVSLWAVCITIVFSWIVALHFYQDRKITAMKRDGADLPTMERNLASRVQQIKNLQAEYDKLKVYHADMEKVTAVLPYTQVLSRLARVMNEFTWLTSLDMDRGKEKQGGILLRLTGFSLRNEELGDFLTGLSREPLFRSASLRHAKEAKVAASADSNANERMNGVQFEIECNASNPG